MNVSAESYGHAVLLNVKGEMTEDTLRGLRQAVDHQLESDDVVDVVFNLDAVPFIDSAALEYLLELQDRLAERFGQVKLVRPEENVATILEITRMRASFDVFTDPTEAVKALRS